MELGDLGADYSNFENLNDVLDLLAGVEADEDEEDDEDGEQGNMESMERNTTVTIVMEGSIKGHDVVDFVDLLYTSWKLFRLMFTARLIPAPLTKPSAAITQLQ